MVNHSSKFERARELITLSLNSHNILTMNFTGKGNYENNRGLEKLPLIENGSLISSFFFKIGMHIGNWMKGAW
jgi:hypothetical protein